MGVADDPRGTPQQLAVPVPAPLPDRDVDVRAPSGDDVAEANRARIVEQVERRRLRSAKDTDERLEHRLRPALHHRVFPEPRVRGDAPIELLDALDVARVEQA